MLAFSGHGPRAVRVLTVKGFDAPRARRPTAASPPSSPTATRASAPLSDTRARCSGRQRVPSRLLVILSDGKPNDVDEYAGRYGIEDTRQAVAEARLQGLTPFCVTVDREAPAYLPAIFGPRGFAVLTRPERLPAVLVEVLRALVSA